jgi:hypothetical protein
MLPMAVLSQQKSRRFVNLKIILMSKCLDIRPVEGCFTVTTTGEKIPVVIHYIYQDNGSIGQAVSLPLSSESLIDVATYLGGGTIKLGNCESCCPVVVKKPICFTFEGSIYKGWEIESIDPITLETISRKSVDRYRNVSTTTYTIVDCPCEGDDLVISPIAVNDSVLSTFAGEPTVVSVASNDTVCPDGQVTTYQLIAGSEVNAIVSPNISTNGSFIVTPVNNGSTEWEFQYRILCNGSNSGETAIATGGIEVKDCTEVQPSSQFIQWNSNNGGDRYEGIIDNPGVASQAFDLSFGAGVGSTFTPAATITLCDVEETTYAGALAAEDYIQYDFNTAPFSSDTKFSGWGYNTGAIDSQGIGGDYSPFTITLSISEDDFATETIMVSDYTINTGDGYTNIPFTSELTLSPSQTYSVRVHIYNAQGALTQATFDDFHLLARTTDCAAASSGTIFAPTAGNDGTLVSCVTTPPFNCSGCLNSQLQQQGNKFFANFQLQVFNTCNTPTPSTVTAVISGANYSLPNINGFNGVSHSQIGTAPNITHTFIFPSIPGFNGNVLVQANGISNVVVVGNNGTPTSTGVTLTCN